MSTYSAQQDASGRDFFLASDDDGHWYIIPREKQKEWDDWCSLDEREDERAWEQPEWAVRVNGSPSRVSFRFWRIGA